MAETLALRLDVETGMYANFPENSKPYTDVKAVVGLGEFNQEVHEFSERPMFRTSEGVVATGGGLGVSDNYSVEPIETGMYVDNIVAVDAVEAAVDALFSGRRGQYHNLEQATFVGEKSVAAAIEALEKSTHPDAVLVRQLALLAVNYANRDVQDLVHQS